MLNFPKFVFVAAIWSVSLLVVAKDGLFPSVPLTDYEETAETKSVTPTPKKSVNKTASQKTSQKETQAGKSQGTAEPALPTYVVELVQARKNITQQLPNIQPRSIFPSQVKGLYKIFVPPRIFYVSGDGKFAIDGSIIDLNAGVNLTQREKQKSIITAVNGLGEDSMVVFAPEKVKHTISVFTDIDCGYCRKLHKSIPEYNKLGIKVRYLAYPRAGLGSPSYKKAVSVWCDDNPKEAMTKAKNGQRMPEKSCQNPVDSHIKMGELIGITGTPAIILNNGQLIPGFVPPARLSTILNNPVAKK